MVDETAYETDEQAVICHRCGTIMKSGGPLFYVVRIEAFPLPEMPAISELELERDYKDVLAELLEQMKGMSSQELMDQVYRRLTVHLCPPCYQQWIENPTP